MGSGSSTIGNTKNASNDLRKSEKEIVKLMMPVYYSPDLPTPEEHSAATASWSMILDDKAPEFLRYKGTEGFNYHSSVTFFYDSFYCRLFDIHPMSRQLFTGGMRSQGKFLVKMLSLSLSELFDPAAFDKNLVKLAQIHYQRGVKAIEYGIVGEILFWCLRHVLGPTVYVHSLHIAWVKVYSRMLTTIVPVAISCEMKGGSETSKNRSTYRSTAMFEPSSNRDSTSAASNAESNRDEGGADDDDEESLVSEKIRLAEPTQSAKSVAQSVTTAPHLVFGSA